MASLAPQDANDPRVMVFQFFASCFQKRPDRTPVKQLPQGEETIETENGDSTHESSRRPSRSLRSQNRTHSLALPREAPSVGSHPAPDIIQDTDMPMRKLKLAIKSTSKSVPVLCLSHRFVSISDGRLTGEHCRYFASTENGQDASRRSEDLSEQLKKLFDGLRPGMF
jgi:hypothetical protein